MPSTKPSRTSSAPSRARSGHRAPVELAFAIAAALGAVGLPVVATGATITVDSENEDSTPGHCSLRDAVRAANTLATPPGSTCTSGDGDDTIEFADGITYIVFNDTMEDGEDSALIVTRDLDIDGGPTLADGNPRVTIERSSAPGTPDFRLIEADAPMTLRSLVLRNGRTTIAGRSGGAIFSYAPPLMLYDCVISGNRVEGDAAGGGGIAVADGADDRLVLVRSKVTGNETRGAQGSGGGVLAPTVTLRYSDVSGNVTRGAGARGGGISASLVEFDASRIGTNTTYGESARGGGIFALTVNGDPTTGAPASFVVGNRTHGANAGGGGIAAFDVELYTTRITGNATYGDDSPGGGISADSVLLGSSVIAGNHTGGDGARGGGFYAHAAQIFNSTISGNATAGSDAAGGGASAVNLQLQFTTVAANRATRGAGIYLTSFDTQVPALLASAALVTGNISGLDVEASGLRTTVSGDHDLIASAGHNLVLPADTLHCDPHLLALGDFGGDTLTHGLPSGSCAIDAGPATGPNFDQRGPGFARPYGSSNDIGAYEAQPRPDPIFSDTFEPPALRGVSRG